MRFTYRVLRVLAVLFASIHTVDAQCPSWTSTFAPVTLDGAITSSAIFDDGTGPALYVGGAFTNIYGVPAAHIARWNGSSWSALGSGVNSQVNRMTVYDDGSGPALYVCGSISMAGGAPANRVARWRGGVWSALGAGPALRDMHGVIGFDDGSGPALYAYGTYQVSSSLFLGKIQRWNGSVWSDYGQFSTIGAGVVFDVVIHDDGFGPKMYAAGLFSNAGGAQAWGIARREGTTWAALSPGLAPGTSALRMTSFDDGSGPALYVFHYTEFPNSGRISRFRAGVWTDLTGPVERVEALLAHDDGTGAALYACGRFPSIGGVPAANIARFDAGVWSPLGSGIQSLGTPYTLTSFVLGGVPRLVCGGGFSIAGGVPVLGLAQWSNSTWSPVGVSSGVPNSYPQALAVHDDGTGPSLFAGGHFTHVGVPAARVARFDGTQWFALADGLDAFVNCLARHDEGAGPRLFAGGLFTHSGVSVVNHVARWDGASWSGLGAGPGGTVLALQSFDDGGGPELCAGGDFPGGVARWNGTSWSPMGAGFNSAVHALCVWDDGSGPKLYAGGGFSTLGGNPVGKVVRWNGTSWSSVGPVGTPGGTVRTLHAHDDGSGSRLYAGGDFTTIGGLTRSGLAAWDGATWSAVGAVGASGGVFDLTSWDDGSGNALYAVGSFSAIGGVSAPRLARWDGSTWTSLAGSVDNGSVAFALAAYRPPFSAQADLFVGGLFNSAGGVPAQYLAHWRGCGHPGTVVCAGDGSVGPCPCGNTGLTGRGCDNSAATGGAQLDANGWNSIAFDSLVLTSSQQIAAGLCVFVQGTQQVGPVSFGDGLLCAGGNLKRLYLKVANGGVAVAPAAGDPSITTQSFQSGDALAVGSMRVYQVYYRDSDLAFCTAIPGSSFNLSNALQLTWTQ